MNKHLDTLYAGFDKLYSGITPMCATCEDHDCEGFVWLMDSESERLFEREVPIAVVDDRVAFIQSFEELDGRLLVGKPKPPCILRAAGRCKAYSERPLVCRMYPVGFAKAEGKVALVLHLDCAFSRSLAGERKLAFVRETIAILKSVPYQAIDEIVERFGRVDEISSFPEGPNSCEVIASLEEIRREGGD